MLAECAGLQDLHLEFILNRNLCVMAIRQYAYHFFGSAQGGLIHQALLHDGREVPYEVLAKVRKSTTLREIKGLRSLCLDFNTFDSSPTGQVNRNGYRDYVWGKVQLSGGGSGPYYDLEEELRKVMLVQKGLS